MMASSQRELAKRLEQGPAVLFLGQSYLQLETGTDLFLSGTLKKFGHVKDTPASYSDILSGTAQDNPDVALAWMHALSTRLSIPTWLKTVSEFAWSAVFSSAIDEIWWRTLRNEWRDTYPVYNSGTNPLEPRSRTMLHATFLYGCVHQIELSDRPPLNRREYLRRRQTAIFLASRMPEVITPFGTLVIDGYEGNSDWFYPEDLVPIIDRLNPGQTHLFNANPELLRNGDLWDFIESGRLELHTEGLGEFLLECEEHGYLLLGPGPLTIDQQRRISISAKPFEVPLELWNQTRRSCSILSSAILSAPPAISDERNYQEFRRFLAESSVKPIWQGYSRGYAFQRSFQTILEAEVERQTKSTDLQEEPIVLSGPTGTGKTVSLGKLAYQLCKAGDYPVLFIERKSQRPNQYDIDSYCKWAEDNGASATVIIWDGMVESYQYYELLRYLTGRGRKVVLVGSTYREFNDGKLPKRGNFISAPDNLDAEEIGRLKTYLDGFDPNLGRLLARFIDATFLVALYRLLPSTRAGIRTGLLAEMGHAETQIAQRAQTGDLVPQTSLGIALQQAGLLNVSTVLAEQRRIGDEDMSTSQELIGLIMVPGRFGLKVPLDLLIRTLDKQWLENIERIVQVDLFEIDEDEHGNITVAPRHPMEAEVICQARFGTAQQEVALAERLIRVMRDDFTEDGQEVQFVVDLVRSMGPNGRHEKYFAPSFIRLSDTLRDLRNERSIQIPRLMLQEATLLREYVVSQIRADSPPVQALELLDRAEETLQQSLQLIDDGRGSKRLRSVILVELGAILASRTRYQLDHMPDGELPLPLYEMARKSLLQARLLAPNDYHSVDIMLWMAQYLIDSGQLDAQQKAEVLADIYYLLSEVSPEDFDLVQRDLYYQRRMKVAASTNDEAMSTEAFDALISQGSAAGYFLRAHMIVGEMPHDREFDIEERHRFERAADYLQSNREAIHRDGRCMFLLLRSWWGAKVGRPLFFAERQTIPFGSAHWHYLIELIDDLLNTDEGHSYPALRYLWGIALFHVQEVEKAFRIFEDLERESDVVPGRRRIARSYLASLPSGEPREFHGSVIWADNNRNRGQLQVEELRRGIGFLPLDFRNDLKKGDSIGGGFHISFNFIGPLADPKRFYKHAPSKGILA